MSRHRRMGGVLPFLLFHSPEQLPEGPRGQAASLKEGDGRETCAHIQHRCTEKIEQLKETVYTVSVLLQKDFTYKKVWFRGGGRGSPADSMLNAEPHAGLHSTTPRS